MNLRPLSVVGFAALLPAAVTAQHLTPGTWSGSLQLTNGVTVEVTLTLRSAGDSLLGTMKSAAGAEVSLTDLQADDGGLLFQWGGFSCALVRRDDSRLRGTCHTSDGSAGEMNLTASAVAEQTEEAPRDALTTEDLIATQATNVYDAIRRLRPWWLRPRGQARIGYEVVVRVYMDSQPMGDVNILRDIEPGAVQEVRFYSASEATTRFGTNNEGGAIVLTRRRG